MNTIKKFEALLQEMEDAPASSIQMKKLERFMNEGNIYAPLFDSHIRQRLIDNVHPVRLQILASSLEKSERDDVKALSLAINKIVVSNMMSRNESFDQFYYMFRHEFREQNHIRKEFARQLGFQNREPMSRLINKIAPNINADRIDLMLWVLEHKDGDAPNFRRLYIMDQLSYEDQYEVLIRALQQNSFVFAGLARQIDGSALTDFIRGRLLIAGDNDRFAQALQNSNLDITIFASATGVTELLMSASSDIPNTIERLYQRAESAGLWEYLLLLGENKNKKDLLRSLVKSKDQNLIDKFFALYKNSPEVKHLVPFM